MSTKHKEGASFATKNSTHRICVYEKIHFRCLGVHFLCKDYVNTLYDARYRKERHLKERNRREKKMKRD